MPALRAGVIGPQFEEMARTWTRRFLPKLGGLATGDVAPAVINDAHRRTRHEIDIVALGEHGRRGSGAPIAMIGEAKATQAPRTAADPERLAYVRTVLVEAGQDAAGAVLTLFSLSGFERELTAAVARRHDVLLVDLPMLYGDATSAA